MNNFFDLEGRVLDKEQQESAMYIGNELVIAGAGAGKTLSIVGKVKYLVEHEHIPYDEILVLAFTDKVVSELRKRINKVIKCKIDILTFHKLGLKVFNKTENEKKIEIDSFYSFLNNYLDKGEFLQKRELASAIYSFVKRDYGNYNLVPEDDIQMMINDINKISLQGEQTKSLAALITCNMLFVNNIEYEYVATKKSMYLYYDVKDVLDHYVIVNSKYKICFTEYTYKDDELSLKGKNYMDVPKLVYDYLKKVGIKIGEYKYFGSYLNDPQAVKSYEDFKNCVLNAQKITSAADAYNDDLDDLTERFCEDDEMSKMFIEIFKEIREEYYRWLKEEKKTDFDFMIKGPVEILQYVRAVNYKYIIVDEYQDISPARFNLLQAILNQNEGYLMAYGDDWQSIYGFSGSNNSFFMNFTKQLPNSKEFYLKNTYRNSQQLIDMSANFIMKNPCQKEKTIHSNKNLDVPIHSLSYENSNMDSFVYCINEIQNNVDTPKTLMVLGRTNYTIDVLKRIPELKSDSEDINGNSIYQYDTYDKVKIIFLTIHRAKGLEADYVFVTAVNNKEFPYEKDEKHPYLNVLRKLNEYEEEKQHEDYLGLPDSEERRLFYVALTRSKNDVYLSVPKLDYGRIKESVFVEELKKINSNKLDEIRIPTLYELPKDQKCPTCQGFVYSVSKGAKTYNFCENKCSLYDVNINNYAISVPNEQNRSNNICLKICNKFNKNKSEEISIRSFISGKTVIEHTTFGKGLVIDIIKMRIEKIEDVIVVKFLDKTRNLVFSKLIELNLINVIK